MSHSEKSKQLTRANEQLNIKLARKLILEEKVKLTGITDEEYCEFFRLAVDTRDTPLVRTLLEVRPKLNATIGAQLLWEVIDDADTRIAEMLVRAGADVNQSFGETVTSLLHVLAKSTDGRKHELAMLMMEHGADVRARDMRGHSVCGMAIKHGNLALAQELMNWGAVAADANMVHAIYHAIDSPIPVESMLLLVNGDHVKDATTRSGLVNVTFASLCAAHVAENEVIVAMVKALLNLKIPRVSVIVDAVENEKLEIVKLLLERTDIDKSTKMMFLRAAAGSSQSTMVRLLIEWGADIDHKDSEIVNDNRGKRPLHDACLWESRDNIQILLHLGADMNVADNYGNTPFNYMITKHYPSHFLLKPLDESCQLVIKHFAMLISKGVLVNDMDLEIMESYPTLQEFHDECAAELHAMKEVRIIIGFSFHSIFTTSIQKLSLLTRYEAFVEGYNGHLNSFPAYRNDLNMRVREAERRKNLLIPKEDAIYESLRGILPDIPIEKIVRYLYLGEVETLKDRLMMLDS